MGLTNVLRGDLALLEPSLEVRRDSTIEANCIGSVTACAQIAREALEDYVGLWQNLWVNPYRKQRPVADREEEFFALTMACNGIPGVEIRSES